MDIPRAYNEIFGRPCYVQFMEIPNYTYLKLKIPRPHRVITMATSFEEAYMCEHDNCKLASALVATREVVELRNGATQQGAPRCPEGQF